MSYPRLPELGPEAYAALKASVAEVGILVPVVRTERGKTIDGRARETIAAELGIKNYPVRTVSGLSEQRQWEMHCALNLNRRHLGRKAKQEYIAACLRHAPALTDNWLGEICGANEKTVTSVRRELEARSEIPKVTEFRGKDGKTYRRFTTVPTESGRHARAAAEALRRLGTAAPGGVMKVHRAGRLARRLEHERHREGPAPKAPKNFKIVCCDFRDLKPRRLDLIFTDPMWSDATIWVELGKWAQIVLKPGGILAAYASVACLPAALDGLGRYLRYHWTVALYHGAELNLVYHWKVRAGWQPLVIFAKGPWRAARYFMDTHSSPRKEKNYDDYQQSLGEAIYYVEALSQPGALVCDPFGGSFTTAVACKIVGRRSFVGCDIVEAKVTGGLKRLRDCDNERRRLH
jgi:site-specific DNA-methyltransferase (adenine-specific)